MERRPMSGLAEVIQGVASRDGVRGVLLLSGDGLAIEHSAGHVFEPETAAALSATLAQHADRLGQGLGHGELRTAVLEFAGGLLILAGVGGGDWLAVVAGPDADVGPLLYDLRHHRPALTALL
jgi:predicted regulator of Ras-like GTPase activity (Roadblock/LC7/MglB family)